MSSHVISRDPAAEPRGGPQVGDDAPVIEITGLTKSFGSHRALDGVDLSVGRGEIMGLLGPNGAGKTTTVRILTTLLRSDSGTVRLSGHDAVRRPHQVRANMGLSGQYSAVDEKLTGFENLHMVGLLYGLSRRRSRVRARELLERFGLDDVGDQRCGHYSGGMRRRLDLAGALVAAPPVVVLDEPTTGLDPQGRQDTWDVITQLVESGTTILLTTQYLEEADRLADSITVIDSGRVIARGTADELKARVGGSRIELIVAEHADLAAAQAVLASIGKVEIAPAARRVAVAAEHGQSDLRAVLGELEHKGVTIVEAALCRPTLDDVFLRITGHRADHQSSDQEY